MEPEYKFTLTHAPELLEWRIKCTTGNSHDLWISEDGTRACGGGLIHGLEFCHRRANGKTYQVTIISRGTTLVFQGTPEAPLSGDGSWFPTFQPPDSTMAG
ncbi:MAG: hypothetical protein JWO94_262 [Verrucomicrobiaceae bacterium]|nr:hypothetical protein [Verrucomicrobiaceae bacterium]